LHNDKEKLNEHCITPKVFGLAWAHSWWNLNVISNVCVQIVQWTVMTWT